jgi:hypothetical protein
MTDIDTKVHFTKKKPGGFEGENLYVRPNSLTRQLIQKLFLTLLLKIFSKKFIPYKNKIISIMNKSKFYFWNICLRFRYPLYFRLPPKQLYAIGTAIKFLKILKSQKIDFFLVGGSLLGAVRQGAFAGRPSDVDFGVKEEQLQKLLDAFPLLIKNGARTIRKNKEIDIIQFLFPYGLVDVEVFRKENVGKDEMWVGKKGVAWVGGKIKWAKINKKSVDQKFEGVTFPISDLENLITIKAYGKQFLAPSNPEIYLEQSFGKNWRIPDKKQFFWNKNSKI